ncbi:MAG: type II toxin-antitoxin system RelE/ParE family toxin [Gammaproteobacteria bacterium]|nr:type II toxin-antitoxin system RelE/ParE family toxin [Gammaproteobacteria bacterium]
MAQVVYTRNALANLERAFAFLAEHDPAAAVDAAVAIREAVRILSGHPLIGRRVEGEIRELVISYGKTGYIALYRILPEQGLIRILAIRHQRELDYPG